MKLVELRRLFRTVQRTTKGRYPKERGLVEPVLQNTPTETRSRDALRPGSSEQQSIKTQAQPSQCQEARALQTGRCHLILHEIATELICQACGAVRLHAIIMKLSGASCSVTDMALHFCILKANLDFCSSSKEDVR